MVMSLLPFRVEFSQRAIADLHRRIDQTRWPEISIGSGWDTGTDDATLRDLARYWRTEYDWSEQQERLNELAHVRGLIDGEELHSVLYTGKGSSKRVPLLLIHGWPGSFLEFIDASPRLVADTGSGPGFDVVIPSLPGFGFSEAPKSPGMHPGLIAERLHGLMKELGYDRYGVQGGDWGAVIGTALAQEHPESVLGLHINFMTGGTLVPGSDLSDEEVAYHARLKELRATETGYSKIQSTRPQTLAYALQDSPIGLLAWILEKFWGWSDHGEDLWSTIDRDWLLTNVMLYWLTGSVLSASRIYYEMRQIGPVIGKKPVTVPTAYARFPGEPWNAPRAIAERQYRLVRMTEPARGGHFAALEQPELFAEDVSTFFNTLSSE